MAMGEFMWVNSDLIEDVEPLTIVLQRKSSSSSKGKNNMKGCSSNMISIAAKESNFEANKLINSEDEAHVLAVKPMVAATRSRREFAKNYN